MEKLRYSKYAKSLLRSIMDLVVECEEAEVKPNTLIVTELQYNLLKEYFPYFLEGGNFKYNNSNYYILINNESKLGLSLVFYSSGVVV
jgi:hypothetical protein